MMQLTGIFEIVSEVIDILGVAVIVFGIVTGTIRFAKAKIKHPDNERNFEFYREDLGQSLLLSLEFLVAADIIRSVAIEPTLESVTILAIIILIRTFLSTTMELEVSGRFPWQKHNQKTTHHINDSANRIE
ncbi:MAG: DUF1622 domain-containing protein [Anaerolineaceae bacterium]|nr:DUF1622 domain-containing protein [Anaerolineaceae bacterium]